MKKMYSFYWRKRGERKWIRHCTLQFSKSVAVRVFQGMLLECALYRSDVEGELRVVKADEHLETINPLPKVEV